VSHVPTTSIEEEKSGMALEKHGHSEERDGTGEAWALEKHGH
jgi:hypothetical protein